jgi:predicted nucleotidyltransferase
MIVELANLLDDICKHMPELKRKLSSAKIESIQIYGGVVKRGFAVSDIDVGVKPKRNVSMIDAMKRAEKILSEVLDIQIPYEVKPDVIADNYIHLDLSDIEKYCDRIEYLTYTIEQYVDAIIDEIKQTKAYQRVSEEIDTIMDEERECLERKNLEEVLKCHSKVYHNNRDRLGRLFEWEYFNVPKEARIVRRI